MQAPTRQKIAILGGGIGALSAAFRLTESPGWADRFDITVYQLGWRLGGKGASSRNPDHNNRIEEHGLHVWAGFYENAFAMMNAVYQPGTYPWPEGPIHTIETAFIAESNVMLAENLSDGGWDAWPLYFPPRGDSWPGDGKQDLPGPFQILATLLQWLDQLDQRLPATVKPAAVPAPQPPLPLGLARADPAAAVGSLPQLAGAIVASVLAAPDADAADQHAQAGGAATVLQAYHTHVVAALPARIGHDDADLCRLVVLIDLLRCIASAIILEGVLLEGFSILDQYDLVELMRRHGALDLTLQSAALTSGYDYTFAYRQGDRNQPLLSAASAVEAFIRLIMTYKRALFFKMAAGAGEIIFAPVHEVLRRRGVRFEFFQRVTRLVAQAGMIDAIEIAVQARPKDPPYSPLVQIDNLHCWPANPIYGDLTNGDALRDKKIDLENDQTYCIDTRQLRRGIDFDAVVVGIPVGALRTICADLAVPGSAWAKMLDAVETTATQALQLWCDVPIAAFGGPFVVPPPTPDQVGPIVTSFGSGFDTWADMSHLIGREGWSSPESAPRSIAYFCSVLPDTSLPPGGVGPADALVRTRAEAWLDGSIDGLWPNAVKGGRFDWNLLHASPAAVGTQRLDQQYWRANVSPSERYVLSLPGTLASRLPANSPDYGNLYLAGDWVRVQAINAGCMECAVMAGFDAAAALLGAAGEMAA